MVNHTPTSSNEPKAHPDAAPAKLPAAGVVHPKGVSENPPAAGHHSAAPLAKAPAPATGHVSSIFC